MITRNKNFSTRKKIPNKKSRFLWTIFQPLWFVIWNSNIFVLRYYITEIFLSGREISINFWGEIVLIQIIFQLLLLHWLLVTLGLVSTRCPVRTRLISAVDAHGACRATTTVSATGASWWPETSDFAGQSALDTFQKSEAKVSFFTKAGAITSITISRPFYPKKTFREKLQNRESEEQECQKKP